MATKKKSVKIRESQEVVFDILKAAAPAVFGSYVFADMAYFGIDPNDVTFLLLEFNEEAES